MLWVKNVMLKFLAPIKEYHKNEASGGEGEKSINI